MYDKEIKVTLDKTLGYEYFMDKEHPLADKKGRVWYHRHVLSIELGRWLEPWEMVHHIDGNRSNNDPVNLMLTTRKAHPLEHLDRDPVPCKICGTQTYNKTYCSPRCAGMGCRKVERPSKEILRIDLQSMSWKAVGRKYGVSDNAVRRWARSYELLPP